MNNDMPEIKKKQEKSHEKHPALLNDLMRAFVQTSEFKVMMHTLLPEIASQWAGKNPLKKIPAGYLIKSFQKSFVPDTEESNSLVNVLLGALDTALKESRSLPDDERVNLAQMLTGGIDAGIIGSIITGIAGLVNSTRTAGQASVSGKSRENFHGFIEAVDFGEIKEAVDGSEENFTAMVKMANEEMWRYPAKMICLLSLLPAAVNMSVSAIKETLKPINSMAPDLLGDVVLSLADDINGKNIGMLINELSELVRKIHTGSALLGEPGKPQLPNTLSRLAKETMSTVDISLLLKSGTLLAEIKEQTQQAFMELLEQSPQLSQEYFKSRFTSIITYIRKWSRKTDAFERLFSDEDIAREFSSGMSGIDAQELADTINRLCGILNRVHEVHPGLILNTLSQTINSLDPYEVGESVRWFTTDVVESVKPVASEILPPVIRGIADLIRHDPAGGSEEIQDALDYLKSALNSREAKV
ncbi:MAG: hypothetical protein MUD12_06460 [Spirochaetes bacterium]|jgi:hypothetical protein|nr:hypothetical protein [Spirochaetota bacterium]